MAHPYSSLQEDWGDIGSSHGEHTAYTTPVNHRSRIPPTAQRMVVGAPNINHYPSPEDAKAIATQNNLVVDTADSWHRSLPPNSFDETGAYRLSDYSDLNDTSATLSPLGPNSVQNVIQYNSGWLDAPYEYSNPGWSNDTQRPAFDASFDQTQVPLSSFSSEDAPYYPGSRLDRQDPSHTTTDYLQKVDQPSSGVIKYDETTYQDPRYSKAATVTDSLHPGTVTSEARSSTRSFKKHTSVSSQGGITTCNQCGQEFSGRYQRGNWARHVRQQHSEKEAQISTDCVCRVCNQVFKRQDARRKHEWKKHGLEDTKPLPRRPLIRDSASHAGTYDTPSEEGTLTCHPTINIQNIVEAHYRVPDVSHRAHDTFATARRQLGNHQYNIFCGAVLTRGERIVEQLRYRRSNLYYTFKQGRQDLSKQLLPQQPDSVKLEPDTEEHLVDAQSNADSFHGGDTSSRLTVANPPKRRRASTASSRFNPYQRRSSKKPDEDPLLAVLEPFAQQEDQSLDCPIHKWHLVHGHESPCNGCGKPYMNGVRQHLLPTYSQQHRGKISFIQRCDNCKEDFVDQDLWERGGHGTNNCVARSQPKGNNLMCWARLFLKIYPHEHQIPSPYRNDPRVLPNELVVRLRHELGLTQLSSIGQQSSRQPRHGPEIPSGAQRFAYFEAELEQMATLDTLVGRCATLLAQLLAGRIDQVANEHVDIGHVTASYHSRIDQLRQEGISWLAQRQQGSQHISDETSLPQAALHQAHASVIGGADFTMPVYEPHNFADMQNPQSETGTYLSSQGYHTGDVSFDQPSLIASSSHTSYEIGASTSMDVSRSSGTQFYTNDDDFNPDIGPSDPTQDQWPLLCNTYLDAPESSRIPQPPTNAQMSFEIDQMFGSPSESHYAISSFAPDDRTGLSDID